MKAEALLAKNPDPSRDEIAHALLGNLCRCTGYVKIVDAVRLAAEARRARLPAGARAQRPGRCPGGPVPGDRAGPRRPDVRGRHDRSTGCCTGRFGSPTIRGQGSSGSTRRRRRRIRASRRWSRRGDVPGRRDAGHDHAGLAPARRRGRGDRVRRRRPRGGRCGTRRGAREAAALVEVEYEVLEPIIDPFDPRATVLSTSRVERGERRRALLPRLRMSSARRSGRSSSSTRSWSRSPRSSSPRGMRRCVSSHRARGSGTTGGRSPRSSPSRRNGCA